jgi:hypothetical protein
MLSKYTKWKTNPTTTNPTTPDNAGGLMVINKGWCLACPARVTRGCAQELQKAQSNSKKFPFFAKISLNAEKYNLFLLVPVVHRTIAN